jgi:hypothetical protein
MHWLSYSRYHSFELMLTSSSPATDGQLGTESVDCTALLTLAEIRERTEEMMEAAIPRRAF